MTNPISFDPFLAWVDTTDPDNLPPEVHVISADDLLRYENFGVSATTAINSLITEVAPVLTATAAATASTMVLRDASGRAKFATPAASTDAATKGYVDGGGAMPFGHVGLLSGNQNVNNAKLTFSAAQILRSGMTFNDTTDALVVPVAGYYRLSVRGYSVGAGFGTEVTSITTAQPKPASTRATTRPTPSPRTDSARA